MKPHLIFGAAILLSGAASAQLSVQTKPIMAQPMVKTIHLPPATIERKIEVLKLAGISIPTGQLDRSVTLSVRDPWVDGNTYLSFAGPMNYAPGSNASTISGHRDGVARSYVTVNWRANSAKRHIVDCVVEMMGRPPAPIKFDWAMGSGRDSATVDVSGGRVATVLPAGAGGDVALTSRNSFTFSSCEITPFG